jgi:hypothetical protein
VSVSLSPLSGAVPLTHAAADPETPRVYLHLEDVESDGAPGMVWEVRLDPDGSGGDPDEAVGTVSFFGRGHAHGGGQTPGVRGERFIFDITDIVSRLEAAGPGTTPGSPSPSIPRYPRATAPSARRPCGSAGST